MLWLIVGVSAYLILAVVFLVDKYLLVGSILKPKTFTFYVGILGISALLITPFIDFYIPATPQLLLSLLAGAIFICALFWFYKGLLSFEASRIVPTVGALIPIFTFLLIYLLSSGREILSSWDAFGFVLLILGTVLITFRKEKFINLKSLRIAALAAFLFSLSFVFTKYVYLEQPFWNGFIWIRLGSVLIALTFLLGPGLRKELTGPKKRPKKKTGIIFLLNQAAGGGAAILQNWAIALAPLAYVAVVNALQGTQYAFLLILAVLLSLKFPKILKEEISKDVILQKVVAIMVIGGGLLILAFK